MPVNNAELGCDPNEEFEQDALTPTRALGDKPFAGERMQGVQERGIFARINQKLVDVTGSNEKVKQTWDYPAAEYDRLMDSAAARERIASGNLSEVEKKALRKKQQGTGQS